jgi:hypothetical protein
MNTSLARPMSALAAEIADEHAAALAAASEALTHARRAGELLLEAKARVPHGSWGPWLEEHFPASARTARLYMSVAERWEELPAGDQNGNGLPLRAAARLLSKPRERERPTRDLCRERFEAHAPALSSDTAIIGRDGHMEVWVWPSSEDGFFFTATFLPAGDSREDIPWELVSTKRPIRAEGVPSLLLLQHGPGRAFQVEEAEWETFLVDERPDFNDLLYRSREDWFRQEVLGKGAH